MNTKTAMNLVAENSKLRQERDRYRAECHAERVLGILLVLSCAAVIGSRYPVAILIVGIVFLGLMFVGGVCWAAKRGDKAMGIEDNFTE